MSLDEKFKKEEQHLKGSSKSLSIIGVFLAAGTLFVAIWFGIHGIHHKKFEAICTSQISLIDVKDEIRDKLKVTYMDKIVPSISKCRYVIRNSGDEPIRPEDFTEMPWFSFGENVDVIDIKIIEKIPPNLHCNIQRDTFADSKITFKFDLLNPDDQVKVDFFYIGQLKGFPKIAGRIAGVTEITNLTKLEGQRKSVSGKLILTKVLATIFILLIFIIGFILITMNIEEINNAKQNNRKIKNFLDKYENDDPEKVMNMIKENKIPLPSYIKYRLPKLDSTNYSHEVIDQISHIMSEEHRQLNDIQEIKIIAKEKVGHYRINIANKVLAIILGFILIGSSLLLTWIVWF